MSDSIELNPLFPFNLIFDTDFGLIKLISKEYRADLFDKSVLDADNNALEELLVRRQFENPLCILTEYSQESKKTLDDYYNEFMGTRYDDILKLSKFTNVGKYCMGFNGITEVNPYVFCKTAEEESFIVERCSKYKHKIVTPGTTGKLDKYDPIFVKNGLDYGAKPLSGHSLFVIRYGFNVYYDGDIEYIDYVKVNTIFSNCLINTIDLYGGKDERKRSDEEDNDC